jgi:hypothetical protein
LFVSLGETSGVACEVSRLLRDACCSSPVAKGKDGRSQRERLHDVITSFIRTDMGASLATGWSSAGRTAI